LIPRGLGTLLEHILVGWVGCMFVVCLFPSPFWERGERKGIVMSGTGPGFLFLFLWDGKKVRGFSSFLLFFFLSIVSLYLLSWGSLEVCFFFSFSPY
jgi:hypothetical protein